MRLKYGSFPRHLFFRGWGSCDVVTGGVPVTSQGNIEFDWHASQMCTIVNTVSEGLAVIVVITVIPSGALGPKPYGLSPRL